MTTKLPGYLSHPGYWTVAEAAALLHVTRQALYYRIRNERIEHKIIGGYYYIPTRALFSGHEWAIAVAQLIHLQQEYGDLAKLADKKLAEACEQVENARRVFGLDRVIERGRTPDLTDAAS